MLPRNNFAIKDHKLNKIYVHDYEISYANVDLRHQYGIFGVDTQTFVVRMSLPRDVSSGDGWLAERSEEKPLY